ncbi:hypothetical protein RB195_022871 [Necator americanus]|uniref:Endonuclease/exonuclease/phosphatase domain-containing protein n=1 Tax=Necator americanus TaxID=51031 RepID=A0ABR1EGW1_NECAM
MRELPARGRSRPKKLVRHRQHHPMRLATLNVGTLTGRSELADSLRKRVDIYCVQETRWKGLKSRGLGDGYKLIYHGTSNRNGVGFILNGTFKNSVTAVARLSDRLIAVKVDTDGESTTFSCITKSFAILSSRLFLGSRVLFYQLLLSKSMLKSNKATVPDDIPTDDWRLLGDRGSVWLAALFNKHYLFKEQDRCRRTDERRESRSRTPDLWQTSVTVPVW